MSVPVFCVLSVGCVHHRPSHQNEVGYVMQDDALLPNLSVRETLQFAYDLRVPRPDDPGQLDAALAKRDAAVANVITLVIARLSQRD